MANKYIKGMIDSGGDIITSLPAATRSIAGNAKTLSNNPSKTKSDSVKGLQRQTYDYNMMSSGVAALKNNASRQIRSIILKKYNGEVESSYADEQINHILTQYRTESANLASAKNEVERVREVFDKDYDDATSKGSLDDFATDGNGGRFIYDGKKVVKTYASPNELPKGVYFLTNDQYYDRVQETLTFEQSEKGGIHVQDYERISHLDSKVDYLYDEVSSWGKNAGHKSNKVTSELNKAYNEVHTNGWKSNREEIGRSVLSLTRNMSKDLKGFLRQEYWKSGADQRAMFHVKDRDENGVVKTQTIDGKEYPLYVEKFINREDIESAKALPPSQRTDKEKEYAEAVEYTDDQKFGVFAYGKINESMNPMIVEEGVNGLRYENADGSKGGSGNGAIEKINTFTAMDALSKAYKKRGDVNQQRYASLYTRENNSAMINGADEGQEMSRRDVVAYYVTLPDEAIEQTRKSNAELQELTMDGDQVKALPSDYSMERRTESLIINGSVIPKHLLNDVYLHSNGVKFWRLPKLTSDPASGIKDWDNNTKEDALYREAQFIVTPEGLEGIVNWLVFQKNAASSDGLPVGQDPNKTNTNDLIHIGGGDINDGFMWGNDVSEMAKQYGFEIVHTTGWTDGDMFIVKGLIPGNDANALEVGSNMNKASKQQLETVDALDRASGGFGTSRTTQEQADEKVKNLKLN